MGRLLCQSLHYRFIFGGAKIDTLKQVTYFFCKILPAFIASQTIERVGAHDGESKRVVHSPLVRGSIDSGLSAGESTKRRPK